MSSPLTREIRELVRLAVPIAASLAGIQLMGVVDTAVVGRLGATELAATGLGNTIAFTISILGMGIVMGIDPLVSQAVGAGDRVRTRLLLWQGVWLALSLGVVLSLGMVASPWIFRFLEIDSQVELQASRYIQIRAIGVIPMLLFMVVRSYLQAVGITRPLVTSVVLGNIFNLVADIILVFGGASLPEWTGPLRSIPPLGVTGAAIATVVGGFLQLAIIIYGVPRLEKGIAFYWKPVYEEIRRAMYVGVPLALQLTAEVGIFALVALLAGQLGRDELAAHHAAITLAAFTFNLALGIGSAGCVRVGQEIGQHDVAGTRRAGVVAIGVAAVFMSVSALTFLLFPRMLLMLITTSPAVIRVGVPLMVVAAVFQISDGIQAVGAGVLRGAGDTRFSFIANLLGHWLVGLPIAILLGFQLGHGVVGLWWGLCAGLTAVAAFLLVRFLRLSSRAIAPIVQQKDVGVAE